VAPEIPTKSGIILGLGEERDELVATMRDLVAEGVSILTLGQYLRPSPQHLPVARYYRPDEFAELAAIGRALGFTHVEAGPLVRSSYHAKRQADLAGSHLGRATHGGSGLAGPDTNGAGSHLGPATHAGSGLAGPDTNDAGSHLISGHPPKVPAPRLSLQ